MRDVRDNIRKYIHDRGLAQATMAERASMTPAQLSATLNKKRKLEAGEFFRLCDAMGVTMEEMRHYDGVSA